MNINSTHLSAGNAGILAGLVGASAGCATVAPEGAIVIGFVSSVLYHLTSVYMLRHEMDDAVDAVPIHLVCGMWGLISAALFSTASNYQVAFGDLFAEPSCGLLYACDGNGAHQLAANLLFLVAIVAWAGVLAALIFFPLQACGVLRVSEAEAEEHDGKVVDENVVACSATSALFAIGSTYRLKKASKNQEFQLMQAL